MNRYILLLLLTPHCGDEFASALYDPIEVDAQIDATETDASSDTLTKTEACVPRTSCNGIVCGDIDDGCHNRAPCGPAYFPVTAYDYPFHSEGGCTVGRPHAWVCGINPSYNGRHGLAPAPDCVFWNTTDAPNSAWCCAP